MRNSWKVNEYGRVIRANCRQRRKLCMLYLTVKSLSHQLQLFIKLRVKEAYLYHVFVTTIINH
jgi:hypothetical protein